MDITNLIEPKVELKRLAEVLDGLGHEARVWAIRGIKPHQQATLFDAAKGYRALTLDDFVPSGTSPRAEVIHHGQNSLAMFTHFQKRFCRTQEGDALSGYNHQSMAWFTGPGYFVARPWDEKGEIAIDYTITPTEKADTWPPIAPNSRGFGRFVYGDMIDIMRGISNHVTIGRARRGGQFVDNWFVLCRQDRS